MDMVTDMVMLKKNHGLNGFKETTRNPYALGAGLNCQPLPWHRICIFILW